MLNIDCFAGGGGASTGLEQAGVRVDIAINHDPMAIKMHKTNHPDTLHLTEDIFEVDLKKYIKPGECKLAQGFPANYIIDQDYEGKPYPRSAQMARIGNSVCPPVAEALVKANIGEEQYADIIERGTV